jgi:leucyl/phenylalanyl-tRNA---protein transferase
MKKKQIFSEEDSLEPGFMLNLYANGAFPMSNDEGTKIDWYMPSIRTIIPLDNYNFPRSLRKFMEKAEFEIRFDTDFITVVTGCKNRTPTWISDKLIEAYMRLKKLGHVHTVEVWQDNKITGGLYGINYKGAFFGESMFSTCHQASKIALIKLIEHLNEKGFEVLDVQYMTEHLAMFGAVEIPLSKYKNLLHSAYLKHVEF